jgi:Replication initiator protein A/DnaA N-terminal domain
LSEVVGQKARNAETIAAEELALIPVEANLEIPPLFQMRRTDPTHRVAECRVPVAITKGERLEQYWRISVPEPYELPGTFDQDTWVAVQTLVNMRGGMPVDGKLSFSLYELLEIMGRPDNGQSYKELREALQRLSATYIYSENAFYSKDIEKFETRGFNLWDVQFSHTVNKKLGRATEKHELEFHSVVRRSFQAEYLKALDKDFYYSLSSRFAKRLYRLIDRKRHDNLSWSVPLEKLKELLPLPVSYRYPSKIKAVLTTAHGELREKGFLTEISYEKAKDPTVRYRVNHEFVRRRSWPKISAASATSSLVSSHDEEVYRLLREHRVWPNVARQLIAQKGAAQCLKYVEALPFQRGIEDTGAWLKWAIESNFELPSTLPLPDPSFGTYNHEAAVVERKEVSDTVEAAEASPPIDPRATAVWDHLFGALSEEISASSLVWFEGTVPTAFADSALVLRVPNRIALEYLESRFGERLRQLLKEQVGSDVELVVEAPGTTDFD